MDVIKQEVPQRRLPTLRHSTLYLRVVNKSTCATVVGLIESIKRKTFSPTLKGMNKPSPILIIPTTQSPSPPESNKNKNKKQRSKHIIHYIIQLLYNSLRLNHQ